MKPLLLLLGTFLFSILYFLIFDKDIDYKYAGRISMCAMLLFTSIGHFVLKKGMENMVPERIPFKPHIVIATGIFEILAGFALLAPTYYKAAGWFLIAFFVLILPANVNASIHHINYQNPEIPGPGLKYLWFRIPLQILFVAWIYFTAIKT